MEKYHVMIAKWFQRHNVVQRLENPLVVGKCRDIKTQASVKSCVDSQF